MSDLAKRQPRSTNSSVRRPAAVRQASSALALRLSPQPFHTSVEPAQDRAGRRVLPDRACPACTWPLHSHRAAAFRTSACGRVINRYLPAKLVDEPQVVHRDVVAVRGRALVPAARRRVVLRHAPAARVERAEIAHGRSIASSGALLVPLARLRVIDGNADAALVEEADLHHRRPCHPPRPFHTSGELR